MADVPNAAPAHSCTEDELRLAVPLHELDSATRMTIATWLIHHGVDLDTLAVDHPVTRDREHGSVTWVHQGDHGLRLRTYYAPKPLTTWPEPFPAALLPERQQLRPTSVSA